MRGTLPLAVALSASCAAGVSAQVFQQTQYNVEHHFTLTPDPAAVGIQILVSDFRHAWAKKHTLSSWGAVSNVQDPDFDPFGTDTFQGLTSENSGLFGVPVACQYESFVAPTSGVSAYSCIQADLFPTLATACNEWDIPAYSTTSPQVLSGRIASSGGAQVSLSDTRYSEAYAFSTTGVTMVGGIDLGNGNVQWGVVMDSDAVGGGVGATAVVRRGDPVHFIAENLNTGVVVDAVLLDIDLDVSGNGHADWSAGTFDTDASEVTLIVDIPPTYVAPGQAGRIEFRIQGGMVTVSNSTGVFAGMLPPAGTLTPLNFPLPSDFILDYDLGLTPGDPWDVRAVLSGGGDAHPAVVDDSCPADIDQNGELNLDDVDGFVGAFVGGDLAADINGDGTLNLDDIDGFIESFLGGCPPVGGEG